MSRKFKWIAALTPLPLLAVMLILVGVQIYLQHQLLDPAIQALPRPTLVIETFTVEQREDKNWYEVTTGERVFFMEWTTKDGQVNRVLGPRGGGEVEKLMKAKGLRPNEPNKELPPP